MQKLLKMFKTFVVCVVISPIFSQQGMLIPKMMAELHLEFRSLNVSSFCFQTPLVLPHLYNARRKASKISSHPPQNFTSLLKGMCIYFWRGKTLMFSQRSMEQLEPLFCAVSFFKVYLLCVQTAKFQTSLHKCADLSETWLFAYYQGPFM